MTVGTLSVVSSTASDTASHVSDTRKRQYQRDEALRKKIISELGKKSGNFESPVRKIRRNGEPGTVDSAALDPALTVHMQSLVTETAQLMAAKRQNCVLVVDDDEQLAGIVTATDIATRCVGAGLNARQTLIADIMSTSPLCITSDTRFDDALLLMIEHKFRHLPVVSDGGPDGSAGDEGDVIGIINMRACLREPLNRIARQQEAAQKLVEALEGAQEEIENKSVSGNTNSSSVSGNHAAEFLEYVESLKKKASGLEIMSLIDSSEEPFLVGTRTTVAEATESMARSGVSAVLVMDNGAVSGVFTAHDVVLRVLAAGLDPYRSSVIRVMTPHPDCALASLRVSTALERMIEGKFSNLPVVDESDAIIGMLSLFHLATAIEQTPEEEEEVFDQAENDAGIEPSNGFEDQQQQLLGNSNEVVENYDVNPPLPLNPLPSNTQQSESTYEYSARQLPKPPVQAWQNENLSSNNKPQEYVGVENDYNFSNNPPTAMSEQSFHPSVSQKPMDTPENGSNSFAASPYLQPYNSASQLAPSYVGSLPQYHGNPSFVEQALQDLVQPTDSASQIFPLNPQSPSQFTIKYRSIAGRVHRLRLDGINSVSDLRTAVEEREKEQLVTLTYIDDEGDVVELVSDSDLREAILLARRRGLPRLEVRGVAAFTNHLESSHPPISTVDSSIGSASVVEKGVANSIVDIHQPTAKADKGNSKKPIYIGIVSSSIVILAVSMWYLRRKR
ncbi:CBS and PB1 domain protein, conserved in fungi and plants, implicated in signalling Mug70 [Schizosaccharomyces pombe]|uniref:Meiotically up-regulated gene 70 protein n=1 Tax=Schizosaccharomyces pombe (strain 972 / ATCC 24843) TaxID=284812 RepID=MUG70_SCHPO|nr:protein mug70 [Schizosaccharomyces pombe]O13965.1 RecName: Full=Meiotically up-regulated gene 70 protein [Schizosaccharomyces pombe 972h-]CAB11262.1 conserved protein Mug20 [Schizosaccharomyces pombe]|eukprot:NP_594030.1 protein mug70 [Schizosaccharomyces pombe]